MVETMSLGTPIGSARMPCVAIEVPPEPPAEIRPPRSRRVRRKASKARPMAAVALPRSPLNTADSPLGWWRATSRGCTLAVEGLPEVERSTVTTRRPRRSMHWRRKNSSRLLVSKVPAT